MDEILKDSSPKLVKVPVDLMMPLYWLAGMCPGLNYLKASALTPTQYLSCVASTRNLAQTPILDAKFIFVLVDYTGLFEVI